MRPGQRVLSAIGVAGAASGLVFGTIEPGGHSMAGVLSYITFVVVPFLALGIWIVRRRPDHPQARMLLLVGVAMAANAGVEGPLRQAFLAPNPPGWLPLLNLLGQYSGLIAAFAAGLLVGGYPDGTVERRWQRGALRVMGLSLALPPLLLLTSPVLVADTFLLTEPTAVPSPLSVSAPAPLGSVLAELYAGYYLTLIGPAVLLARFVTADAVLRRRIRPLLLVISASMVCLMAGNALRAAGIPDDTPAGRVLGVLFVLVVAAFPATVVFGILRHRLFDIDLAVRRSAIAAALTLVIAAGYVALAAAPGIALGGMIPVEFAVLVTVVAALAFQPLRRRVEGLADRWVFGARVNRYELLTAFGAGLEQTVDLPRLLPRLAETVRRGLDAGWVRVSVPGGGAVAGEPRGEPALTVPLREGQIECGPKEGGYDAADRELLTTLAGQAGTAIANLRLTAELADRLDELAASRARIVVAGDTERRRIERDIHDGVQQHVVALITKIWLARNALARGERPGGEALAEVQGDARALLADLRELAHGIHPPVLSDRGLVAAVEARVDRLPIPVDVRAPAPLRDRRFGPDVEGAAYFVVCEALTNVVKHAGADSASVELDTVGGQLRVRVRDDGIGVATTATAGQGLTNLRDRVEALGGELAICGEPGAGTVLTACLPSGTRGG